MIEFRISDWAYGLGIRGAYACVDGLQQASVRTDALAARFVDAVQRARERYADVNPAEHDVLRGFRELHATVRADRKMISSPENLIRLVQKRGSLPRIHPLVDVYNLVSLETQFALGAHDLARTVSPIELRQTTGAEAFHPLGAAEAGRAPAGEYAYIDGTSDVICRLEARQVEKTKITADTRAAFIIIQGNARTGPERIAQALDLFAGCCRDYLAVRVEVVAVVR